MFKPFIKSARGFTLIELLVVIAIIGILSSIVLASLNTARLKSRDARRIADMKQLQLAMQLYFDANTRYPTSAEGLTALTTPVAYIATVPKDPIGAVVYPYDSIPSTGSPTSYHMGASLEESTNPALQSDLDNLTDTGNLDSGADATGCVAAAAGRYCYDVGP